MTLLNQIVAIEKGVKQKAERSITDAYHVIQKPAPLSGIARNYQPKDEDGDVLPPESTLVQVKVDDVLADVATALTRMFDVILTKEIANTEAKANVVIGEDVILADVPVTYLLFLDKQLIDLQTFVSKLPTLDAAETWTYDPAVNVWATMPTMTTRTKKIPRNWVKAEATDKHPAQVEVYHEDVIVGYWTTRKFSGAIPTVRRDLLLTRIDALRKAVAFAREQANTREVEDAYAGEKVFGYLFGP